jgi:hypothetical protein
MFSCDCSVTFAGTDTGVVMSVLYRAIWNDDRTDLLDEAHEAFRGWVAEKTGRRLDLPDQGEPARGV